jgi:Putative transposase
MSHKCHCTKSLRDSPLRGRLSRERCPQGRESACSGPRCPVLKIEVSFTSLKTGVAYAHGYYQSAAPAHDRGHGLAQAWCAHAAEPPLQLQALPVRVLSRLFRRLFLKMLRMAHAAGRLAFFGNHAALADTKAFAAFLAPLRKTDWVVYAKEPFGGPQAVLAYLSHYTHRVAISNRRLIAADESGVTFKWKDYRIEGPTRYKTMTLPTHEFIRRFLMHVLPKGVHRIRHYGLFANANRAANIARARDLLAAPPRVIEPTDAPSETDQLRMLPTPCPCCGGRMIIIETFARGCEPKYRTTPAMAAIRIDTS